MSKEEYLASYCASTDCKNKLLKNCDLCMYEKGRRDQKEEDNDFFNFDTVIDIEKRKSFNSAIDKFTDKALAMLKAEQDTRYGYLDCMDIREIAKELKEDINE